MQEDSGIDASLFAFEDFMRRQPSQKMDSPPPSPPIVRSVAMSANIASTVRDEVKHLIQVKSLPVLPSELKRSPSQQSEDDSDFSDFHSSDHFHPHSSMPSNASCSHSLPVVDDCIVSAFVLSRWDDIMGPRTIRVWLPETIPNSENSLIPIAPVKFTTPRSVKGACQFTCSHHMAREMNTTLLMKAIKYVTSHTVNYTCVTGTAAPERGSSALFVVPDLEMVAQSVMFHVPLSGSSPHSLALVVNYRDYEHYLSLRSLCQHWLERLANRLADFLISVTGIDGDECPASTMVDNWMVEMCNMLMSLKVNGLGYLDALQNHLVPITLSHPIIERAITSHLQTAGCSIVMGNSATDINAMISFLALFLDEESRCCSRFVRSGQRDTFHIGLYLQGLLLDEYGCRELSSEELGENPLPVTWIDLSRRSGIVNAVRQGPPLHFYQSKSLNARTVMQVVKEESNMVRLLIKDLRQLAPHQWSMVVTIFMQRLHRLALTLLNVIHWNGVPPVTIRTNSSLDNPAIRHLCATLHIDHPTFLIVLSHAERIKPGAYRLVMEGTQVDL